MLQRNKMFKESPKSRRELEPKQASLMELFREYT